MDRHRKRIRVLIADDTPEISGRVVDSLSELEGIEIVGPAGNGPEALQLFDVHRPEILIVDLQMPGMSGFEVIREIRRRAAGTLVIVLTGHENPEFRAHSLEIGANYFLGKTTDFERLTDIIRSYVTGGAMP